MFRLAHISDPHLGPLPPVTFTDILNKRFFGYLSWLRRRRALHRLEVLAALVEDMGERTPDHLVVTGDLTNIALEEEFTQVAKWLHDLGTPEAVSVIPGNHDAYVDVPWETSLAKWQPFMSDETESGAAGGPEDFPFVRYRGPAAIIGLSSAQPTPLFCAHGTLGDAQLNRLAALLNRLGKEGWFRVVLLHHPPSQDDIAWRKRLVDAVPFCQVVSEAGAELVLHGHDHTFGSERIASVAGDIPVMGVPSASAGHEDKKPTAHYQLYDIESDGNGWRIGVTARGYDPSRGDFGEVHRYTL